MVKAAELYSKAAAQGVTLWVEGDRLKCRCPADAYDESLLQDIKEQRSELIAYLNRRAEGSSGDPARPDFSTCPGRSDITLIPKYLSYFWTAVQEGHHGIGYTNGTSFAAWTKNAIDPDTFRNALRILVARYDILAARIVQTDQGEGLICDVKADALLQLLDASDADPLTVEQDIQSRLKHFFWDPFDVSTAIFRILLAQLPDGASGVALVIHHFFADDVSVLTLVSDLCSIYSALVSGDEPQMPPVRIQYPQYLSALDRWCQSDGIEPHIDYWKRILASAPATSLRLAEPLDLETASEFHSEHFFLGEEAVRSLEQKSAAGGGTLFMGLMSVIAMSLRETTGQQDLSFKTVTDGRHLEIPPDAVGRYTNLVTIRLKLEDCHTFEQVLENVRAAYLDSFTHWICPYEVVYPRIMEVSQATDSPLVSFRDFGKIEQDSRHLALLGEVRTYDYGDRPGGQPPPRKTSGKYATNWELVFHRAPEGIVGRFTYHPLIHDQTKTATFYQSFMSAADLIAH